MSNPKEATKLENAEILRMQNLALKIQLLAEQHARAVTDQKIFADEMHTKYYAGEATISVTEDGTIVRVAAPAPAPVLPTKTKTKRKT